MKCAVCGERSQGYHFGIETCRACAVFFRRSIVTKRSFTCFNGPKRCILDGSKKRGMCSFCRLKKCKEVGMAEDNIQFNRDVNKVSIENEVQKENMRITTPEIEKGLQKLCINYDLEFMSMLNHVFVEFIPDEAIPSISCATSLKKMEIALLRHRERRTTSEVIIRHLNIEYLAPVWSDEKLKSAEWFMFIEEFASLPIDSKMIFFRNRWRLWRTLERLQFSIERFGEKSFVEEKKFMFADGIIVDWKNLTLDLSPISTESSDNLRKIFGPCIDRYAEVVGNFLIKMKLERFEFTYLLCVLAFHIEDLPVDEKAHAAAVKFRDRCSSDLHIEYLSRGIPNYMARLTAMFDIINEIEKIQREYYTVAELASVFDVVQKNICSEHYES